MKLGKVYKITFGRPKGKFWEGPFRPVTMFYPELHFLIEDYYAK